MTITREDLAAAAAVGVLQYRQVDPLLVFLLQRDVRAQRLALSAQACSPQQGALVAWLFYLAGFVALVSAALFTLLFASHAATSLDVSDAWVPAGALYLLGAILLASWFRKRGYCARMRLFATLAIVSVPLALLVVQQVAS